MMSSRTTKLAVALFIAAMVLLLAPNYPVFIAAAGTGTLVGVVLLSLIVDEPSRLRFSLIVSATLLLAYGGGSFSTWINALSYDDFLILTKQRPQGLLCASLGLVYICCGIAMIISRYEPPIYREDVDLPPSDKFSILVSAIGLTLIVLAYFTGELGYEGIRVDVNTQRIPVLGATAVLIASPLAGLLGYLYGRSSDKVSWLYYIVSIAIVILSIIPSGRRQIILALVMIAVGYAISGAFRQHSFIQKLALAAAAISLGYFVSACFFAIRLSVWELGANSTLIDQLYLAAEFVTSPALEGRFNALLYDNLRERTFVLGYLADLIEATGLSPPLYGEALSFYVKLAIPSVLDPSKVDTLSISQIENFAHPKLGLPVIDQANTILTDGVTDFGVAGAICYLLALLGFLSASLWGLRKFNQPCTFLIMSLTLVHLALKPEITLSEYLVTVRNLLWIVPMIFVCEYIWRGRALTPLQGQASIDV